MLDAKMGEIYLGYYTVRQKEIRKWYKIITLVFSTGGALGWKVWNYAPIIACAIIAVVQLLSVVENQLIPVEKDIEGIAALRAQYLSYFNKLERLWVDHCAERTSEEECTDRFYSFRQLAEEIEIADSKLTIKKPKCLVAKAETEAKNYFTRCHQ